MLIKFDHVNGLALALTPRTTHGNSSIMRNRHMTPELCRGARAILGWKQQEVADLAQINRATLAGYEDGTKRPQNATLNMLRMTFDKLGLEFFGPPEELYWGVRIYDLTKFNAAKKQSYGGE